ncbi:hypothetical protein MJT46_010962 [Ovis ammon polii x Ovis aries]|nr:hypothetical protein MJT46_010962 [Ovis ammon polii x Ovis aries]
MPCSPSPKKSVWLPVTCGSGAKKKAASGAEETVRTLGLAVLCTTVSLEDTQKVSVIISGKDLVEGVITWPVALIIKRSSERVLDVSTKRLLEMGWKYHSFRVFSPHPLLTNGIGWKLKTESDGVGPVQPTGMVPSIVLHYPLWTSKVPADFLDAAKSVGTLQAAQSPGTLAPGELLKVMRLR